MENQEAVDAAQRLQKAKKEILARWEYLVRSEFTEAQKESKPHLIDSLPQFLDQVIHAWSKRGIQRIIENLCSNAVKYGAKNLPILISVVEVDDQIALSVKNQGDPIPKDARHCQHKRMAQAKKN